jgi:hypothetical protein
MAPRGSQVTSGPVPAAAGSRRAAMVAASQLRAVPRPMYLAFLLLAIFVQCNWGLYGVSTRFLQVRGGPARRAPGAEQRNSCGVRTLRARTG